MKAIEGFSPYFITENGKVFNKKSKRYKRQVFYKGYYQVNLHKNLKQHSFRIHRLLAFAFIPNPENKPYINHKDGNKANNKLSNLEWCTPSENSIHAYDNGLNRSLDLNRDTYKKKWSKPVLHTLTGIYYDSAVEAAQSANMLPDTLRRKLRGILKNNTPFILC